VSSTLWQLQQTLSLAFSKKSQIIITNNSPPLVVARTYRVHVVNQSRGTVMKNIFVGLLASCTLLVQANASCVDLEGQYAFQVDESTRTVLTVQQTDCSVVATTSTTTNKDDVFEFFDKFHTDGVFRRYGEPAPYASYEMAQVDLKSLKQYRIDVRVRRNVMEQFTTLYEVRLTANGDLHVQRTLRDDSSETVLTQERTYQRIK
jgi:hypothetical protein